ncbi:MAG: chemotaxis protein CheW [candidate division WOR-3 bacterium]
MEPKKEIALAVFSIGDEEYAVSLDNLVEILFDCKIDQLPHLEKPLIGTIVYPGQNGKSIPVVDLASTLGIKTERPKRYLLILQEQGEMMAFLIDSPTEIVKIDRAMISPLPSTFSPEEKEFLEGIISIDSKLIGLIRPIKAAASLLPNRGK